MSKSIGYSHTVPKLKSAIFKKGKMILKLEDSRALELPLGRFPEIKQLTPIQRRKHKLLAGNGLMFDNLDIVYHISDFLGWEVTKEYLTLVAGPKSDYRKPKRKV